MKIAIGSMQVRNGLHAWCSIDHACAFCVNVALMQGKDSLYSSVRENGVKKAPPGIPQKLLESLPAANNEVYLPSCIWHLHCRLATCE